MSSLDAPGVKPKPRTLYSEFFDAAVLERTIEEANGIAQKITDVV